MSRAADGPYTWARLVADFGRVRAAVLRMETSAADAADERTTEAMAAAGLPEAVALVQDLRRRLALVEVDLVTALGRSVGKHSGELSDGRLYELTRSGDRKGWNHEDWKHDVRREVVKHHAGSKIVVDADTGEETPLATVLMLAITEAQEVHGSTSPRTTQLKALGLYAGDYSTTEPGPWRLTTTTKD